MLTCWIRNACKDGSRPPQLDTWLDELKQLNGMLEDMIYERNTITEIKTDNQKQKERL